MQTTNDLTLHFTLAELTHSQTADRRGIDNAATDEAVTNLTRVAQTLERVRVLLGSRPITISSGYRSPDLNRAVGGAHNSAHLCGLAADFICPGYGTPLQICKAIAASNIDFDQLIQEGTWVHLGLAQPGQKNRRQVLTAKFANGVATYQEGL
ncbi:D-Ala-D-Ala carboxypeptidase family metallohydrolase [Pandoraea sputorum]|uniref:D-Ala-D-Ala carboxypeptidase family metallohydrolase n=1 Tax=Pandoraea sputorum TaxID=93222 RepID=UPI00124087D9|nr:D-Ala-D-Ala carboxypeptidase family metallohydrolase [Pandoraea sputorum]VVE77373.1 peptidase M15 [Pandoraea sputorum]